MGHIPPLPPKTIWQKNTKYYIIGPTFGTFLIIWIKLWANFFDAATFKVPFNADFQFSSLSRENSTVFRHTAFLYSPKKEPLLSLKKTSKNECKHQKSPIFCYYMN